jgi:hypothetical protein
MISSPDQKRQEKDAKISRRIGNRLRPYLFCHLRKNPYRPLYYPYQLFCRLFFHLSLLQLSRKAAGLGLL